MIKRTPQEIADFFQCFVVENRDYKVFSLYEEEPDIAPSDSIRDWEGESISSIDPGCIDITPEHKWNKVYVPRNVEIVEQIEHKINKVLYEFQREIRSRYIEIFTRIFQKSLLKDEPNDEPNLSENPTGSAPHQSEVHTHREYIIMCADNRITLEQYVMDKINHGWELSGGIAVDKGFFYQAMVRGLC